MSIQDWGALGEMVGGIAVIVSIVYLALQLRRSTRAAHRQTYQAAAVAMSELLWNLAKEPELDRLFRGAVRAPDALSREELLRGYAVLDAYLSLMESFYLHNIEFGEQESQARWARILVRLLANPGGGRYWEERRWQFHEHFACYVDALCARPAK